VQNSKITPKFRKIGMKLRKKDKTLKSIFKIQKESSKIR